MLSQAEMGFVVQSLREIAVGQIWDEERIDAHRGFLEKAIKQAKENEDHGFFTAVHGIVSTPVGDYVSPESRAHVAQARQLLKDHGHPVDEEVMGLERTIYFRDFDRRLQASLQMLEGNPDSEAEVSTESEDDGADGDQGE